ncbi:PREDICTED: uncharacterized protein LOC109177188 [Ipomoea nil]|uniref:uncharacterized protein LOC109177188 n=1 Tax=Ipomoea nil TaxID=35883 RepID=UPI000900A070|nr:PREDICTED: uncharacterized protein LOC109177188 [Ipomoea nil]
MTFVAVASSVSCGYGTIVRGRRSVAVWSVECGVWSAESLDMERRSREAGQDQIIVGVLLGSCSETIQPLISSVETASEAWSRLSTSYASDSHGRIIYLKSKLTNNPKGNRTIAEYLSDMRKISDALAAAQSPVSENDLITYVLNQLGDDYGSIVPAIRVQKSGLTYGDLNNILSDHERALKQFEEQRQSLLVAANVTQKHNSSTYNRDAMQNNRDTSQNRGQGNYRYKRGNGNRSNNGGYRQNLICCFCNFQGHETKFCRKLARFLRDHNVFEAPQSQTYASGPSINSSVSGTPPTQ